MIWKVCSIQKRTGKIDQIPLGSSKGWIVPTFSLFFELIFYQWRFYPAYLSKGQHFEHFKNSSFGNGWILLDLTLRVEQCSGHLGKIRPNGHIQLDCVFGVHASLNNTNFGLPNGSQQSLLITMNLSFAITKNYLFSPFFSDFLNIAWSYKSLQDDSLW